MPAPRPLTRLPTPRIRPPLAAGPARDVQHGSMAALMPSTVTSGDELIRRRFFSSPLKGTSLLPARCITGSPGWSIRPNIICKRIFRKHTLSNALHCCAGPRASRVSLNDQPAARARHRNLTPGSAPPLSLTGAADANQRRRGRNNNINNKTTKAPAAAHPIRICSA